MQTTLYFYSIFPTPFSSCYLYNINSYFSYCLCLLVFRKRRENSALVMQKSCLSFQSSDLAYKFQSCQSSLQIDRYINKYPIDSVSLENLNSHPREVLVNILVLYQKKGHEFRGHTAQIQTQALPLTNKVVCKLFNFLDF